MFAYWFVCFTEFVYFFLAQFCLHLQDHDVADNIPDNLKVLFRPVAMFNPDFGLIAELMLKSFGFDETKVLSQVICISIFNKFLKFFFIESLFDNAPNYLVVGCVIQKRKIKKSAI